MAKRHGSGTATAFRVECLGPTELRDVRDNRTIPISLLQRRLLAALALRAEMYADSEWLIDTLWDGNPPRSARASLHNQVSRLRERAGESLIESNDLGYRLGVGTDIADVESLIEALRTAVNVDTNARVERLTTALSWWRGEPFVDIEHLPQSSSRAASLRETRRTLQLALVRAMLQSDSPASAVSIAESLVAESPLDETGWAALIEALMIAGRRGDALSAFSRASRELRERLGVLPGVALRDLHRRLLDEPSGVSRGPETLRIVGRDDVVARVVSLVHSGQSLVIAGEDGSGRTTLAREVWRVLRRRNVRSAFVSVEANASTATAVFDDILDELGLPRITGVDAVSAFVRSINDEAEVNQVVMVIDDISHAGPSTLSAFEQCLRHHNVHVVATVGLHDEVPNILSPLHMEVLEPLSDDHVRQLVRESGVLRGELSEADTETLVSLAGGNPLLLGHLLADAFVDGVERADLGAFSVSSGVARAVDRLLEPHTQAVRRALDIAAVIGRSGPMSIWEELATAAGVRGVLASGLVEQRHEEFRFRHGAVARVRGAALTAGMRNDIQRGFADAASRRGLPVLVYAAHSFAAQLLNARAAYDDCMKAGSDTGGRGMHRDASVWFARARNVAEAHLPNDAESALRARIRAGDSLRLCGDPSHVNELLACAEASLRTGVAGLITDATYALLQFGGTSQRSLAQQQAMHVARRAMRAVHGTQEWALLAAATTLTVSLFDDPTQAREDFRRALAVARDPLLRMRILPYAYLTFGHPRDLHRRIDTAAELLSLAQMTSDAQALFSAHHQHWANALVEGDYAALLRHHEAMEVLVERIGTLGVRWEFLSGIAALNIAEGNLVMAERFAHEAHDLLAPVNPPRAAAVLMSHLFAIRRAEGRLGELVGHLAAMVHQQPVGSLRALYAATLVESDPERAVKEALAASQTLHNDFTWLPAQFVIGEVLVNCGATQHAPPVLTALEPWVDLHAAPLTCSFGAVRDVVNNLRESLSAAR